MNQDYWRELRVRIIMLMELCDDFEDKKSEQLARNTLNVYWEYDEQKTVTLEELNKVRHMFDIAYISFVNRNSKKGKYL